MNRKTWFSGACLLAGVLLVLSTGCSTLRTVLTDPVVIQDVVGAAVAIAEDNGTPEATIHTAAVQALAVAGTAQLTIEQLQTVLASVPGFGVAVIAWSVDNPELAQTTAALTTWLQAIVTATTPATQQEANVKLRIQARRFRREVSGSRTLVN
jgi:hypothetical protein